MTRDNRQLPSPFPSGGGGHYFEACVQASFVLLMLAGGSAPALGAGPIAKIKLQGRFDGYETDDLIVFVGEGSSNDCRKILGQIKYSVRITQADSDFRKTVQAAWNDFNNPAIFERGRDVIALITGLLSRTDTEDVRTILEWSRFAENSREFFNKVALSGFSSDSKRGKLKAFRVNLTKANGGEKISDEDCYQFLRHFHLLCYDLDTKSGVIMSLVHSMIGRYSEGSSVWSSIVEEVQNANKNAGTITPDSLPGWIRKMFDQQSQTRIPEELKRDQTQSEEADLNQHECASELALINLAGSWNEKSRADLYVLNNLVPEWNSKAKDVIQLPGSPLSLRNGFWEVGDRVSLWNSLGSRIFDDNLDTFRECAVSVLKERAPSFDLPWEERYAASIYGKAMVCSQALRRGIADGLAMIGSMPDRLENCSQFKPQHTAVMAVSKILRDADYILWGSLNNLLPSLAEAAPGEFLLAVETALNLSPCPFDELFSQEETVLTGSNYMNGLLRALEGLAWDENYLVRVCVLLGEFASRYPGGRFANRTINSLVTVLLPWFPRTIAPFKKRKVAVETLYREFPEIAWKLNINLLHDENTVSDGSYKPRWRKTIPENWKEGVTQQQYWGQVSFYSDLAVSKAGSNTEKLNELIDRFNNLPKPSSDKLLRVLASDLICDLSEANRFLLWDNLKKFISRHRKFSEQAWALGDEALSSIEVVAEKIAPNSLMKLHQRLFRKDEFCLYEKNDDFENQHEKLEQLRQKAVEEILESGGIESAIEFAEEVESPKHVGYCLGKVSEADTDAVLLPEYLTSENPKLLSLAGAYVWSRRYVNGWSWVDHLDKSGWNSEQIGQFFSSLPFVRETWNRAAKALGSEERAYWLKAEILPYQADREMDSAIEKLIKHGRSYDAINCLHAMLYKKQPINVSQCVKALLSVSSPPHPSDSTSIYWIVEVIKFLQTSPDVSPDDLFQLEWIFLPLLRDSHKAAPKFLEARLARDPEFFYEVIQLIYPSEKIVIDTERQRRNLEATLENARRLLHNWCTPPGTREDGSFDDAGFLSWLDSVKEIFRESEYLDLVLCRVGKVLIHCPADEGGLWINRTVAEALNDRYAEPIREGFRSGIVNSRGAYWVDPAGKPELELAEQFREKAEDVENAGYQRFAVTLRTLSEFYVQDANRLISEHGGQ